ncbi:MAG TPA: hypothetical protein VJC16_00405 [Candidatus Nanoarchaeia archaeon]|nr:hypothetical protein [Candidatus Nanoarchaeia archaeon]
MKRAQLAMESVMIYGVVILIVIVAIGALIRFGVFDLSNLFPEQCDLGGSIQCEEYAVTAGGVVQLEIRNNLGKNIEVQQIVIEGEEGTDNEGLWGEPNCKWAPTAPATFELLANGVKQKYDIAGCDIGIPEGKKIDGLIKINYNTVGSSIVRPVVGSIRATVQP